MQPFYREAAEILNKQSLQTLAADYQQQGKAWSRFAQTLLPSEVSLFKQTKETLKNQEKELVNRGEAKRSSQQLTMLEKEAKQKFPWKSEQLNEHLMRLQAEILALHQREVELAEALQKVVTKK